MAHIVTATTPMDYVTLRKLIDKKHHKFLTMSHCCSNFWIVVPIAEEPPIPPSPPPNVSKPNADLFASFIETNHTISMHLTNDITLFMVFSVVH